MSHVLAQVNLLSDSLLPEDLVVNTWHFDVTGTLVTESGDISDALEAFYINLSAHFGASLQTNGHVIKFYDMTQSPPRVPILVSTFNLGAIGGTSAPREVACCLSYQGAAVAGLVQARRRGRVFIGPFDTDNLTVDGKVAPGLRTAITAQADILLDDSQASAGWTWAVFSTVNNNLIEVNNGWVDDSWDTIRSRGLRPTARTTFGP
jgi:hypothetical protein